MWQLAWFQTCSQFALQEWLNRLAISHLAKDRQAHTKALHQNGRSAFITHQPSLETQTTDTQPGRVTEGHHQIHLQRRGWSCAERQSSTPPLLGVCLGQGRDLRPQDSEQSFRALGEGVRQIEDPPLDIFFRPVTVVATQLGSLHWSSIAQASQK